MLGKNFNPLHVAHKAIYCNLQVIWHILQGSPELCDAVYRQTTREALGTAFATFTNSLTYPTPLRNPDTKIAYITYNLLSPHRFWSLIYFGSRRCDANGADVANDQSSRHLPRQLACMTESRIPAIFMLSLKRLSDP